MGCSLGLSTQPCPTFLVAQAARDVAKFLCSVLLVLRPTSPVKLTFAARTLLEAPDVHPLRLSLFPRSEPGVLFVCLFLLLLLLVLEVMVSYFVFLSNTSNKKAFLSLKSRLKQNSTP